MKSKFCQILSGRENGMAFQLDLLNIVIIGIVGELPGHDDKYELHCLLSAALSMELSVDEKSGILETEYGILLDDKIREADIVFLSENSPLFFCHGGQSKRIKTFSGILKRGIEK